MNVEKKMDMSLDDIIKSNRPSSERRKPGEAKSTGGNQQTASKKAAAARKKGGKGAGKGQGAQANHALAPRQTAMKKQVTRGRAPIHVTPDAAGRVPRAMSITINNPKANAAAAAALAGTRRKGGRRSPPPGFVSNRSPIFVTNRSMQPPPGLSRGGRGGGGGGRSVNSPAPKAVLPRSPAPKSKPATLNERFSQFSTPAVAVALKNAGGAVRGNKRNNNTNNNRRRRNKASNWSQPTDMEQ